ncbi:hypothetical protein [Natronosalvus halobius]|uniref:hypothetical protein n=1 Tax=Natronosalvus halobius TaxID=2953746 RepID=UPI00209D6EC7|nr:hypothetical protein [Natronosalvus halobius]USZ70352.1 hypothetical protein NGM15_09475 [Natronosalvus halobius]
MSDDRATSMRATLVRRGLQAMAVGFVLSGLGVGALLASQDDVALGVVAIPPLVLCGVGVLLLVLVGRRGSRGS